MTEAELLTIAQSHDVNIEDVEHVEWCLLKGFSREVTARSFTSLLDGKASVSYETALAIIDDVAEL